MKANIWSKIRTNLEQAEAGIRKIDIFLFIVNEMNDKWNNYLLRPRKVNDEISVTHASDIKTGRVCAFYRNLKVCVNYFLEDP